MTELKILVSILACLVAHILLVTVGYAPLMVITGNAASASEAFTIAFVALGVVEAALLFVWVRKS